MKGPMIIKKYCCEDCDSLIEISRNLSHCELIDLRICIWNYNTPRECPYLIKAIRKEKLIKINQL